jgi:hypothetical protein
LDPFGNFYRLILGFLRFSGNPADRRTKKARICLRNFEDPMFSLMRVTGVIMFQNIIKNRIFKIFSDNILKFSGKKKILKKLSCWLRLEFVSLYHRNKFESHFVIQIVFYCCHKLPKYGQKWHFQDFLVIRLFYRKKN